MANHVFSHATINANQAGMQKFDYIVERLKRDPDPYEKHLSYAFFDDPEDVTGGTMIELTGAKWAYANDISSDYISIYSAWNYVEQFYEYLAYEIGQVDPAAYVTVCYEDEMPNFIGASIFDGTGLYDQVEFDSDEVDEYIRSVDPEIAAEYNSETEEYTELGEEYLSESASEHIQEWQTKVLQQMINGMLAS
jgi:hypothetical protein